MGISSSKQDDNTALLLCKDRVRFVKHAIDSRYALSAAQLSYLQSLRNVGPALRQLVEAETSTELPHSPSHSSYASLSPSPIPDLSSLSNGTPSPFEKNGSVNYMRASGVAPMLVSINLNETRFMEEEGEENSSWDFFDPTGTDSGQNGSNANKKDLISPIDEEIEFEFSTPIEKAEGSDNAKVKDEIGKEEDTCQYITHRAKDMVSSMREIEHHFIKAAESGHEVSRMLETRKIRLNISSETIGKSSASALLLSCLICCKANGNAGNESEQHAAKVITWNRSVSSQSSSSRNPLILQSKDETTESGSDFIEEFSMISGSHSSTLDRLYAWERKLYDELKASESLRKAYDQKRTQLRHQFARDFDARVIDKTRAIVKDLHSRLMVAIQAVNSISRRIEKLRDEELHPQLVELVQGLTRMWRAMLETYHAQQITTSLAYHTSSPATTTTDPQNELQKQALIHLRTEIGCLQSTFANWVKHHRLYVESLNSWLQNCILQPQGRSRGRKMTFSPRRALAPPIFVLLRDWSNSAVTTLSEEALNSIKLLSSELNETIKHVPEKKGVEKGDAESKLRVLQTGLVRIFEQMRKFSESLVEVYEKAKEESERARCAYIDGTR